MPVATNGRGKSASQGFSQLLEISETILSPNANLFFPHLSLGFADVLTAAGPSSEI